MIELVQTASEEVGLLLNVNKTKVMTTAQLQHFKVKGVEIDVVRNFNFLGSVTNREGQMALHCRCEQAPVVSVQASESMNRICQLHFQQPHS